MGVSKIGETQSRCRFGGFCTSPEKRHFPRTRGIRYTATYARHCEPLGRRKTPPDDRLAPQKQYRRGEADRHTREGGYPVRRGLSTSLRANGSRECAPDDRLREAIHVTAQRKNGLLRFARNDGWRHLRHNPTFSRHGSRPRFVEISSPSSNRGSRECRVHAAPAVSCAMCTRKCAHEHTGTDGTLRHSLRNGFTAYAVLSPATNSSCHRRCRLDGYSIRLNRFRHRQLGTSHGCRDHTVLPYASAPFVLRARVHSRQSRPANIPRAPTPSRPPHPASRS